MKNYRIEAMILAAALIVFGVIIKSGFNNYIEKERVVTVKGLSETNVPADLVIYPIVYKEAGNNPVSMYETITQKNDIIINFLKERGITDSEISISAPSVYDTQSERYSTTTSTYRYKSTSVITITSNKVDTVRKIMQEQGQLMKKGIAIDDNDYSYQVRYQFTKLNDIKPQMVEDATQNARQAAEKFASDSGSKLGKIRNATQGSFSITDSDPNTPYIKNIRVVTTVTYYLEN